MSRCASRASTTFSCINSGAFVGIGSTRIKPDGELPEFDVVLCSPLQSSSETDQELLNTQVRLWQHGHLQTAHEYVLKSNGPRIVIIFMTSSSLAADADLIKPDSPAAYGFKAHVKFKTG